MGHTLLDITRIHGESHSGILYWVNRMRIEYKKPIIDKIMDAIRTAEENLETIERIWIDEEEYKELWLWFLKQDLTNDEIKDALFDAYPLFFRIHGVLIEKERNNE